jgi:hypothetical protein
MTLIRMIFRRRVKVGVVLTENTAHVEPLIRSAARNVDLDVEIQRIELGDKAASAIASPQLRRQQRKQHQPDRALVEVQVLGDLHTSLGHQRHKRTRDPQPHLSAQRPQMPLDMVDAIRVLSQRRLEHFASDGAMDVRAANGAS